MALRIVVLVLIILVNAFFAASEVALVSVRQSRLRELADQGQTGAQSAINLLANPSRLLSVTQFGVTIASLGLGWAGEDTLYGVLRSALQPLGIHVPPALLHGFAFAIAFLVISYAHVIAGEVVPKNLAIDKADRVAVLSAPALLFFYRISQPFVIVIERTTDFILRRLSRRGGHHGGGHSPEELKFIVQSSGRAGHLQQFEQDAIQRVIELSDYTAREIMTPRHNIVSLPVDASLEQVLATMTEHKFARLPVYENDPEHIVGILHYKDLLRIWDERRFAHDRRANKPFRLRRLLRKPVVIPETKPLNQLIDEFRTSHTQMALVVDEFGTVAGLVTLEDVFEQVFGDISDEHDLVRPPPPLHQDQVLQLDGSTTIRDLETRYSLVLPGEAGFETLAGFLLFRFGYIPKVGDSVDYSGRKFTITQMDRNRIANVLIEKLDVNPADPANEG